MVDKFNVLGITSDEGKTLLQKIKADGGITLLVGSAISMWEPTFLPPGQIVTNYLAELLVDQFDFKDPNEKTNIIKAITRTPFEYVWDQAPNNSLLPKIVIEEFKNRHPNPIHKAIKELVSQGIVKHIITTNYDTCLDQVFKSISAIKEVTTEQDSKDIKDHHNIYFKIHGSAVDGLESTVVYRLSQEGVLQGWKRKVLAQCITNATLLVIGYSGLDFEICPEITLVKPTRVIWNVRGDPSLYPNELSPNSLRVLGISKENVALWGDMRLIFSEMGYPIPDISINKTPPNWELPKILSKTEIQIWACSVVSPPGYAAQAEKLARKILSSLDEKSSYWPFGLFLLGDAFFHKGKYIQSAENCSKAAEIFWKERNFSYYIKSVSREADALRCGGHFWDALLVISVARSEISKAKIPFREKKKIDNELNLKELLVYRDFYEIAKWIKNNRLARYYQQYAEALLSRIVKTAEKEGQWNIFQQSKMWANRLEINFTKVYKGTMQPLDDWFGFTHLGAIIPQMMAARDALWRKGTTGKETTLDEIKKLIIEAENIESFPEIWKLSLAYNETFSLSGSGSHLEWETAFKECEYTDFLRKFKLANPKHR